MGGQDESSLSVFKCQEWGFSSSCLEPGSTRTQFCNIHLLSFYKLKCQVYMFNCVWYIYIYISPVIGVQCTDRKGQFWSPKLPIP